MILLSCLGFSVIVLLVCIVASIRAAFDPHLARDAPSAYAVSYAGLVFIGFTMWLYPSLTIENESNLVIIWLYAAPLIIASGAFVGYHAGIRRKARAQTQLAMQIDNKRLAITNGSPII